MTTDLDLTKPGPAGLYFRPERLTPAGWEQEMAARARLDPRCSICGIGDAVYGYGRWTACEAPSCRDDAKARWTADEAPVVASERAAASPVPAEPAAAPSLPLDLFSRSEAA